MAPTHFRRSWGPCHRVPSFRPKNVYSLHRLRERETDRQANGWRQTHRRMKETLRRRLNLQHFYVLVFTFSRSVCRSNCPFPAVFHIIFTSSVFLLSPLTSQWFSPPPPLHPSRPRSCGCEDRLHCNYLFFIFNKL